MATDPRRLGQGIDTIDPDHNVPPARFDPPTDSRTLFGHPAGLFLLFIVEMWERFSYYGMRGLLVLYMITVVSVHQLRPGTFENTLKIEELAKQADNTVAPSATMIVPFQIRVGDASDDGTLSQGQTSGEFRLRIERLRAETPDAADPQWVPDAATPATAPVRISGSPGAKGGFQNRQTAFLVSNPTDQEIEVRLEVAPDPNTSRVYISPNNTQGKSLSVRVKPDAERGSEAPLRIVVATNDHDSGRNWSTKDANTMYGWYTGLAYLFPVIGGILADRFIGTHRSMVLGGILIALGHVVLGVSGFGDLAQNRTGLSAFIGGLALIILGTGHFKPCVSTMVGELYQQGDPRRDGGFSIFYMGINLGAFLCAFVCGTLGQTVGWHWGFGSAAVGMIAGLVIYLIGKPYFLKGIGAPPANGRNITMLLFVASCAISAVFAWVFHLGAFEALGGAIDKLGTMPILRSVIVYGGLALVVAVVAWFVAAQRQGDKGPTASIFLFMLFNAFFWTAFEQAGGSMNVFAEQNTDRSITLPNALVQLLTSSGLAWAWVPIGLVGLGLMVPIVRWTIAAIRGEWVDSPKLIRWLLLGLIGLTFASLAVLRGFNQLQWVANFNEIPATWFQSINAGFIFIFAPLFAWLWLWLGKRSLNPSQPAKIGLGLILAAAGFVFMVFAGMGASKGALVSSWWLVAAYFLHTMGELCLSPTGLSYVTKAAPLRFVSLLMGVWFVSSFIANLSAGLIGAQVEAIERGEIKLPWSLGGQADFYMLFVIVPGGVGILVMLLVPLLKKLMRNPND